MTDPYLLQMKQINKSYSGIKVLKDVNFNLRKGEVHALVGENGAGKSTLIKILMGVVQMDSGSIELNGTAIRIKDANFAAHYGISTVFQELSLFPYMSVAENVYIKHEFRKAGVILDKKRLKAETLSILDYNHIDLDPNSIVEDLSMAKRQLVEIVKAIVVNPRIIVLDEPTSSLTLIETEILFNIIRDMKSKGCSVIYISHRMNEIFQIADRVTVLRDGNNVCEADIDELDFDTIVRHIVGRSVDITATAKDRKRLVDPSTAMEVRGLSQKGTFRNIGFHVNHGEILGFAGLVGSGRTELMRLIFGIVKATEGEVIIDGQALSRISPQMAIKHGIAMVPESRQFEGLILAHSIEENITLAVLRKFVRFCVVNRKKVKEFVSNMIQEYGIKTESEKKQVASLSGGNQQKVVIAKWIATSPKVLILDEATAGIDVQAKAEIYRLMKEFASKGMAILLVSSDMPELLNNADRILVVNDNKIIAELTDTTQEEIMSIIMKDKAMRS